MAARSFDRLTAALKAASADIGDDPDERFIADRPHLRRAPVTSRITSG
ncbi:MAG: hypothetical protein ACN6I7_01570 [bacterium]